MLDHQDKLGECFQKSKVTITCNCKQWYMRTCITITVFGVFVICWCVYCTILIVRLTQELDDLRQSRDGVRRVHFPSNGGYLYPEPDVGLSDQDVVDSHVHLDQTGTDHRVKRSQKADQTGTDHRVKQSKKADQKSSKKRKQKKKSTLKAVHFVPASGLQPKPEHNYNSTIEVFKPASWVTDSPFTTEEHGRYRVDHTGTYLIYAQVLYKHDRPFASLGVVQHRPNSPPDTVQSHYCTQEIPTGPGRVLANTCTLTALFQLQKDDYITLENNYIDPEITYSATATYFGAVLLS